MQALPDPSNRRTSDRFEMRMPVQAETGGRSCAGASTNFSSGGACIELEGYVPAIGESITVSFEVPGAPEVIKVDAEVRWTTPGAQPKCGIQFRAGHQRLLALLVAGVIGAGSATASAAATTSVPTFDPAGDVVMDMDSGGERPDQQLVLEAFSRRYDAIDACVVDSRGKSEKQLVGEAHVAVLLNPKGATPLGVNAELPAPSAKDRRLHECLRAAAANAEYPSYDGPPIVVEFDFDLDPGFEEVPAE
jgi:PilZ domain